uniref:Uncharacterized protein n=1 Tax=Anguilla anguilla TaxID=7936 RepID=A0A0E9P678_ANGAN
MQVIFSHFLSWQLGLAQLPRGSKVVTFIKVKVCLSQVQTGFSASNHPLDLVCTCLEIKKKK